MKTLQRELEKRDIKPYTFSLLAQTPASTISRYFSGEHAFPRRKTMDKWIKALKDHYNIALTYNDF